VALLYVGLVGYLLDRIVAMVGHALTRGTAAQ
jgi:nitrate/nitrite transport system permease protein